MNQSLLETSPEQSYRLLPLTRGYFAKISPEDWDWASRLKWQVMLDSARTPYAVRAMYKIGVIRLHRVILGLPDHSDGRVGDHINHDTLDCRRENLRISTRRQNSQNRRKGSHNKSGYKGVYWQKYVGFRAQIRVDGKLVYLGKYATAEEAYRAYCEAAQKHFGEFACP